MSSSYSVVVHGVGPPFGHRRAFKMLQLLQQLLAEASSKHCDAVHTWSFNRERRTTFQLSVVHSLFHIHGLKIWSVSFPTHQLPSAATQAVLLYWLQNPGNIPQSAGTLVPNTTPRNTLLLLEFWSLPDGTHVEGLMYSIRCTWRW